MKVERKFSLLFLFGIAALIAVIVMCITFGSVFISPVDAIKSFFLKNSETTRNILLYSRFPRLCASLLAGAALATSGAVLQQVLANKLASPSIVGVNAGAGLGITVAAAFGVASGIFASFSAFLGSVFAVILISLFAKGRSASKATVILGGVALNSMFGAISESIAVLDDDVALLTTEFRVGGFSSVSYSRLVPSALIIIISLILLFFMLNELDVISLGDEIANGLGMPVKRYRIFFMVISALLAGAAVSFSGLIGFVGLIIPHFVRTVTGSEGRRLVPLCALYGALFVSFCDMLSRVLFLPYEIPVGIILSLVGCPIFIVIVVKLGRGRIND